MTAAGSFYNVNIFWGFLYLLTPLIPTCLQFLFSGVQLVRGMSWWYSLDKAGQISKLAYSALKNAQQKIDEVLDINDNEGEESKTNSKLHSALHIPENESSRPESYVVEQQKNPGKE